MEGSVSLRQGMDFIKKKKKVSKVYTLLFLISMFIRQRKIAGRTTGRGEGYLKHQ